jgi:hypothetical protein
MKRECYKRCLMLSTVEGAGNFQRQIIRVAFGLGGGC